MKVFLVRHGQTTDNRDKLHSHPTHSVLTDLGKIQAEKVAKRMLCEDIDKYIVSTTIRTRQTAKPIYMQTSTDIVFDADIQEVIFGKYAGLPSSALKVDQEASGVDYMDFVPEGGESRNQFKKRITSAYERIIKENQGENICLICHGGVIRVLLGYLFTDPYNDEKYRCNNTGINLIEYEFETPKLIYAGDLSHLEENETGVTNLE